MKTFLHGDFICTHSPLTFMSTVYYYKCKKNLSTSHLYPRIPKLRSACGFS